jgi:hypothetical protein
VRKVAPLISRFAVRRREPVDRDRYRAVARTAGIRRARRRGWLDAALGIAITASVLLFMPRVAAGLADGADQLLDSVAAAIPMLQGQKTIDLPSSGGQVGAAPVLDNLPLFTRDPQLQLAGRVPSFVVQSGRTLQIVLNGAVVQSAPLAENGAFVAALALKEGANAIAVAVLAGRDVISTTSASVTLDRTPPTLDVTGPANGAVVDAQNVVVQGKTEPGSSVTINGRTAIVTPEGTFSDYSTATPGTLQITVVSRDRAGNETTQRLSVNAEQPSRSAGAVTLTVTLSSTSVRPGQFVLATVGLRDAKGPKAGVQVALSVGVVFIGSAITDASGTARITFAAPPNEGEASVVVLGGGASGRATLTVAR